MKFEKLNNDVVVTNKSFALTAEGTIIQTKVGLFWVNDGTDDKVPLPA